MNLHNYHKSAAEELTVLVRSGRATVETNAQGMYVLCGPYKYFIKQGPLGGYLVRETRDEFGRVVDVERKNPQGRWEDEQDLSMRIRENTRGL